ncbi:hypothetical protein [Streptomyces sp. KL116D]|uniref:hypothetical protein n=1 Tax=Streptomyces sp. KL116D TaxID=3045152 RepID=UPI003555D87B
MLLVGCGTADSSDVAGDSVSAPPSSPSPSFTGRPECAKAPSDPVPSASPTESDAATADSGPSPENPHYDENHAYRMSGQLTAENRAAGEATVRLIRPALEKLRKDKQFSEESVRTVLSTWGCGDDNGLAIASGAPQYERVWFSFHNGSSCVSAEITTQAVTTEVYGAYAEPDPSGPCVENRGGH